jgi:hypothetical protein
MNSLTALIRGTLRSAFLTKNNMLSPDTLRGMAGQDPKSVEEETYNQRSYYA